MKGIYEHNWQEAMAGATIEPSEALWNNISSKLDGERGHNYWVTLLMIAATVTMAFALPLTMGNLDYNARPDQQMNLTDASSTEKMIDNEKLSNNNDDITNHNGQITNNTQIPSPKTQYQNKQLANNNEQLTDNSINITSNTKTPEIPSTINQNTTSLNNQIQKPNTQNLFTTYEGLHTLNTLGDTKLAQIESYYMIPVFTPVKKNNASNSMLALLNMGTGSVNNNSSFSAFKGGLAYADAVSSPDFNNITTKPSQNTGTAYFVSGGVELPVGKRWALLTSIGYRLQVADGFNNKVLEENGSYKPLGMYAPTIPGTIYLNELYAYSVTNQYLSVPVTFKYPFVNRKFKFRGGFGLATDFMLSNKISSDTYGSATYKPKDQEYKQLMFAALINLDFSYSINNQYSIAFETGYRKGLTAIDQNDELYPSSFSAGIIIFYKIK